MTSRDRGISRVCGRGRRPYIPSSPQSQVPSSATNNLLDVQPSPSPPPRSPNPHIGDSSMPHPGHSHMPPFIPSQMPAHNHPRLPPSYPIYPGQSTFIPTPGYYGGYQYPPHFYLHPSQNPTMHFSSSTSSNIMRASSSSGQASPSTENTHNRIHIEPTRDT